MRIPPGLTRWLTVAPVIALVTFAIPTSSVSAEPTAPTDQSGSTSSGGPENPQVPNTQTQSNGERENITDAAAEITKLERAPDSNLASMTIRITNNGPENIHDNEFQSSTYLYYSESLSGISVTSSDNRFFPVMDDETHCLCSGYASREPYAAFVKPKQSIDYWAMYSLPGDISSVDVEIPGFDPIKNVPVG